MQKYCFQPFWFELHNVLNAISSFFLVTWKTVFHPKRRHDDVAGGRDLP